MSTLVIQIPARQRLRAGGLAAVPAGETRPDSAREYAYALTADGLALGAHGRAAAAALPKADTVVAVLADADVAWHRITLPKAPANRLRAALVGVLEEALLEDAEATHFAVAPQAVAGQPCWIAATHRQWLRGELARLMKAQVFVDRVVPASCPDDPPHGHFAESGDPDTADAGDVSLTWSHADGVSTVRLGGLARALVPLPPPQGTRWTATPGAATAAERWLGAPVAVMPAPQRLLQAARTLWNLRQFDLARRSRGTRAAMDALRRLASREWRPARVGLAVLVLAHVVGLNLWALDLRQAIEARRATAESVVKASFPQLSDNDIRRAMSLVMQREVDALRLAAGQPGEADFEPMLRAAALAWPSDQPPPDSLRYEPGTLTLGVQRWAEPQIAQFRSTLQPLGWQVEAGSDGRVVVTRADGDSPR